MTNKWIKPNDLPIEFWGSCWVVMKKWGST